MRYNIEPAKTYKTEANALKALEKNTRLEERENLSWTIMIHSDGRFFPVFFGTASIHAGMHFRFNTIAL